LLKQKIKNKAKSESKPLDWEFIEQNFAKEFFTSNHGVQRRGVRVEWELVGAAFDLIGLKSLSEAQFLEKVRDLSQKHDSYWRKKVGEEFKQEALANIEGSIRYYQLTLRKCKITYDNPMIKLYFREL